MKSLLAIILTMGLASAFPAYAAGSVPAAGPTTHVASKHKPAHAAKHHRKPRAGSTKESK